MIRLGRPPAMPPIQSPKSPLTNNGGASSTPNIIDDLLLTSLFDPPNVIAQHVAGNPNDVQETASSIPPPEPFPPSIYPDFGVGGILVNRDADSIQNPTSNGSSDSFGGSSLAATDASFASSGFPFQLSTFPDYNIGNNSTADMNRPSHVVYAAPPSRYLATTEQIHLIQHMILTFDPQTSHACCKEVRMPILLLQRYEDFWPQGRL